MPLLKGDESRASRGGGEGEGEGLQAADTRPVSSSGLLAHQGHGRNKQSASRDTMSWCREKPSGPGTKVCMRDQHASCKPLRRAKGVRAGTYTWHALDRRGARASYCHSSPRPLRSLNCACLLLPLHLDTAGTSLACCNSPLPPIRHPAPLPP